MKRVRWSHDKLPALFICEEEMRETASMGNQPNWEYVSVVELEMRTGLV